MSDRGTPKALWRIWPCLVLVVGSLLSCSRTTATAPPPTTEPPTPRPTPTLAAEPTPRAQRLILCTLEPQAISPFVTDPSADDILSLYDEPPIERVGYGWEARLVERVPSLLTGDVITRSVPVSTGMRYADPLGFVRQFTDTTAAELPQLVVTFTLKPDLLWSDGQPITSRDAILGYHLAQLPEAEGQWHDLVERTASFVAVDELTLRWEGIPGYLSADFPGFMFPLQPAHRWQGQTLESILSDRTPPATGAFRITAWESGREVRLAPNDNYAGPAPKLEEVIVRFPQVDPQTWTSLVADGTCDVIPPYPIAQTSWQQWANLGIAGQAIVWADVAPTVLRLDLNTNPVQDPTHATPLQDPRLRTALSGCISRKQLTQALPSEALAEATGFIPPNHPAYVETEPAAYNPEASGRALDEIGWQDENGDGVREAHNVPGIADGEPLSLTLSFASQYFVIAAHLAANLETCGVGVNSQPTDARQLYSPGPESPLFGRTFDMALLGWQVGVPQICGAWLSQRIPGEANDWSGENFSGYTSEEYDAACRQALSAIDVEQQYTPIDEAHRLLNETMPTLFLAWRPFWFATRSDVLGIRPDVSATGTLWNIEEISIEDGTPQG